MPFIRGHISCIVSSGMLFDRSSGGSRGEGSTNCCRSVGEKVGKAGILRGNKTVGMFVFPVAGTEMVWSLRTETCVPAFLFFDGKADFRSTFGRGAELGLFDSKFDHFGFSISNIQVC